jgi:hypothetical protein
MLNHRVGRLPLFDQLADDADELERARAELQDRSRMRIVAFCLMAESLAPPALASPGLGLPPCPRNAYLEWSQYRYIGSIDGSPAITYRVSVLEAHLPACAMEAFGARYEFFPW